ncbi:T9SS type A sorting domain-containing protein [Ulvibacterium sp.]|uniref:T9SS type A sorting domain-containing protein n=1 Tax=Ulvibacterium sp. TaxID=2665914 RepID=UPI003BABB644
MRKIYFGIFMLFAISVYGQEGVGDSLAATTENSTFKLYPNPALDDVVYITTAQNFNKDIVIYDVFGEVVLTDRIRSNALNISKLVSGVYVLQVTENNKTMTRKLVVK